MANHPKPTPEEREKSLKMLGDPPEHGVEPAKAKDWAMRAWMTGNWGNTDIARAIGTSREVVWRWCRQDGWLELREEANLKAARAVVKLTSGDIKEVLGKALKTIKRSIDAYDEEDKVLNPSEMSQVAGVFERLFKVSQLLGGNPTEILQGASLHDVMLKLRTVDIIEYQPLAATLPETRKSPIVVQYEKENERPHNTWEGQADEEPEN